jgi:hypothetical protein
MLIDSQRIASLIKYQAALSTLSEASLSNLEAVLASDANLQFVGFGKYVGARAIWEFAHMLNAVGIFTPDRTIKLKSFDVTAAGFFSSVLDKVNAFSGVLKFVRGSYLSVEFQPCSDKITTVSTFVDDFTFTTLTTLQAAQPQYNEKSYCETLMKECTGDAEQFASFEECMQFSDKSSLLDTSCKGVWGFGNSKLCRMINQYAIKDGDVETCARVGPAGGNEGSTCGPGDCNYRTIFDNALLWKAKSTVLPFSALGSHACIDGLWEPSEYMFTLQSPVADGIKDGTGSKPFECLVLGQDSYFKMQKSSEEETTFSFDLKLATRLRDFGASGKLKYSISTDASGDSAVFIIVSRGGKVIARKEVPIGSSSCLNLFSIDLCTSYGDDTDIESRRLSDKKPVKLFLKVDGEKTESIVVAEESPVQSTDKPEIDTTTSPATVAYSSTASLHMTPIALIAISMIRI